MALRAFATLRLLQAATYNRTMATDPKILKDIIKNIRQRDVPFERDTSVTREDLERQAKGEAEEEAKQEAQKAYDETYADAFDAAYQRILDELLDDHGFSDC